jgi:glycosyltransferase involved in cell wall biosynthesis
LSPQVRLIEYRAKNTRNNPLLWKELAHLIRDFSPHLVHTHFAKATTIYRTLNLFLRKPFIATKHNPRKGAIYEKIQHVIAVSKVVQDSVKSGNATLIYNGLIPERPTRLRNTDNNKIKLLCVGRLDPIKGYDKLLEMLGNIGLPWELTILGEGDQRRQLEAQIKESGMTERVHLPGFRSDIPEQMARCDICIFSSHSEGCSLAMLEAMHYSPLVLSTRTGLAMELFPDWLLWDLGDPGTLATAIQDYRARQIRFEEWVSPLLPVFHMDNIVRQHLQLYRQVIST